MYTRVKIIRLLPAVNNLLAVVDNRIWLLYTLYAADEEEIDVLGVCLRVIDN